MKSFIAPTEQEQQDAVELYVDSKVCENGWNSQESD